MKRLLTMLATALLVAGCAGLYTTVVTITQIRKDTMNEIGRAYREGKISPETDAKIAKADSEYLKAAAMAEKILVAYKEGTATKGAVAAQILGVKAALTSLIDIAEPFLVKPSNQRNQLAAATQL